MGGGCGWAESGKLTMQGLKDLLVEGKQAAEIPVVERRWCAGVLRE